MSDGKLILLTLPIGNLDDITYRAKGALEIGNHFVVEDTRIFKKLLSSLAISIKNKSIISFHDFSSTKKIERIILELKSGKEIYLASDAGTPIISDPAYPLIQEVLKNNIKIETLPGVSSVLVALELSGFSANPFHFYGFFPRDNKKRVKIFELMDGIGGTFIFFESPKRMIKSIEFISDSFPTSKICIARELTKKFESIYRFKGCEFNDLRDQIVEKGEVVILINIEHNRESSINLNLGNLKSIANDILSKGYNTKIVAKLLSEILGRSSKEIYKELNLLN